MVRCSRGRSQAALGLLVVMSLIGTGRAAWGQTPDALGYSVATPRPISPSEQTDTHMFSLGVTTMGRLTDKNILITGGNSGIGLAAAQEFDREGARVAICGLNEG